MGLPLEPSEVTKFEFYLLYYIERSSAKNLAELYLFLHIWEKVVQCAECWNTQAVIALMYCLKVLVQLRGFSWKNYICIYFIKTKTET